MDRERLEAWTAHAEENERAAIVGVSLGGKEGILVFNWFDDLSDSDFEDVLTTLFALFSGRPGRPVEDRLKLMGAAFRHACAAVMLEEARPAGEA